MPGTQQLSVQRDCNCICRRFARVVVEDMAFSILKDTQPRLRRQCLGFGANLLP